MYIIIIYIYSIYKAYATWQFGGKTMQINALSCLKSQLLGRVCYHVCRMRE